MEPKSRFLKVKCNDCQNEQVIFGCASKPVTCLICGRTLSEPTGGKAFVKTQIIDGLKRTNLSFVPLKRSPISVRS
jgi:small subunit ribosomal protein S27e